MDGVSKCLIRLEKLPWLKSSDLQVDNDFSYDIARSLDVLNNQNAVMSQDEPVISARKAKKVLRDAQRAGKHRESKKQRKADEVVDPHADPSTSQAREELQSESAQKSDQALARKRKRTHESQAFVVDTHGDNQLAQHTRSNEPKKRRKQTTDDNDDKISNTVTSKSRFIVFVGNLPYSTTDDSLDKHFAKLKPYTLRHRTDPKTKKSKGFAFVEFNNFDRLKTCLKLYHHSFFDPDNPGIGEPGQQEEPMGAAEKKRRKSKGRKINVELTAGGGGSTDARKEKIRAKNVRLGEQRARRMEAERKNKERKRRKAGQVAEGGHDKPEEPVINTPEESLHGGMHPSRLARLQ